jgi:flavin reductase ActVB
MLLVCISRSGVAHDAFVRADRFAVNVLRGSHTDLAHRFAAAGIDRFAGTDFEVGALAPHLPDALSVLICTRHAAYPGGDHTILVGAVEMVRTSTGDPLVYFDRKFCSLNLIPVS